MVGMIAIVVQLTQKLERMVLVVLQRAGNAGIFRIICPSYIQGTQISITMRMQNTNQIKHTLKIPVFLALCNTTKTILSNF
jgi:hypothetical protein